MSDQEVCELYSGTFHVPLQQHSGFYGKVMELSVMLCHVWCGTDGMCCPVSHNPLCTDGYCLGLNLEMSSAQMFQVSDTAYPYCYINPDLVIVFVPLNQRREMFQPLKSSSGGICVQQCNPLLV